MCVEKLWQLRIYTNNMSTPCCSYLTQQQKCKMCRILCSTFLLFLCMLIDKVRREKKDVVNVSELWTNRQLCVLILLFRLIFKSQWRISRLLFVYSLFKLFNLSLLNCTCVRLLCLLNVSHLLTYVNADQNKNISVWPLIKYICFHSDIFIYSLVHFFCTIFCFSVRFATSCVFLFLPDTITNNIRLCIICCRCCCYCYCLPMYMPLSLLIHRSYGLTTVTYKLIEMAKTQRSYNKIYLYVYVNEREFLCVWRRRKKIVYYLLYFAIILLKSLKLYIFTHHTT